MRALPGPTATAAAAEEAEAIVADEIFTASGQRLVRNRWRGFSPPPRFTAVKGAGAALSVVLSSRDAGRSIAYYGNQARANGPAWAYELDDQLGAATRPWMHCGLSHFLCGPANFLGNLLDYQVLDDQGNWDPKYLGRFSFGCPECEGR
jgi:hypothetical protein